MNSFHKPEQVVAQIRTIITRRGKSPTGALFTFVLRHTNTGTFTIAGRVRFSDDPLIARPSIRHHKLSLIEEWITGPQAALERLQSALSGAAMIDSTEITGGASYTTVAESGRWHKSETGWKEWYFSSRLSRSENLGENDLPSEPILAPHSPPFVHGAHAMQEWLHKNRDAWESERDSAPWELMTILPDTRIRITDATWAQTLLTVMLEVGVPEQTYEVQVLYGGSSDKRHDIAVATPGQLHFQIPEGTETVHIFIIDDTGELLSQRSLRRPVDVVSAKSANVSEEEQTRLELLGGEGARVEFKPYVESKDQSKEAELIKTVVAFSNTEGGRLYVGVDDSGVPQGFSELKRATKRTDDNVDLHIKSITDRLDQLFRSNVKPPPRYELKVHDKEGRPVIIVDVKKGDQPPYATSQNEYFVRHGSSSMRPDPSELRRLMQTDRTALWPFIDNPLR